MYLTTSSYRSPRFRLIFSASDLWKTEHSWLITPDVVKTNGVNEPCSTSIILRLYNRFFSSSCFLRMAFREEFCWLALSAFVILTSKNAFWPRRQNPFARMSSLASSLRFAVRWYPTRLVTGWRPGSHSTSYATILSMLHSKSLRLLWRAITKPPRIQFMACVTSKATPHGHVK